MLLNPGPTASSSSCISNNTKLNCVLLNSRSLCNKIVEFQGLVYGNNLDVVTVTETWLHDGYFDGEVLSSSLYTVFRKDRGGNKRGGGVLLAVKTDLLAHRRPDLEPPNSEIFVCDFVSPNSFKITFCLCYRPPNCSLFMDYFECLLVNLSETTGRICIVGDFTDMPTIDWEYVIVLSNSTDGVKFCNLINSHFLTQVVKEPTRISHSAKTVLDLVFYNYPEEIFED